MSALENLGNQTLPSVIKDPFSKVCIKSIFVHAFELSNNKWMFSGKVEFENGMTVAEQKFKGESFDHVVIQIKSFLEELKG